MMKKKELINLISVFLVLAVILSSALIASYAIFNDNSDQNSSSQHPSTSKYKPQQNNSPDFSFDDFGGLLNLNGALGLSSLASSSANINVYSVKSTESERAYFKIKSFGDYNGINEWEEAEEYSKKINNTHSALYLPALLLETEKSPISSIQIYSNLNQFILPYYPSITENTDIQTSDVICTGDASNTYTIYFYSQNLLNDFSKENKLNDSYEQEYRKFVYSNYLSVDDVTFNYLNKIITDNNFSVKDAQIIEKVADYISHAAEYDMNYDRALDREENVAIAFLEKYKTGICQHYATAATLLFRSLGIPARYTVGFASDTVADTWVNIQSKEAHAWVEVYIDEVGWQYVEVTGSVREDPPAETTPEIPDTAPIPPETPNNPDTTGEISITSPYPPETSTPFDTTDIPYASSPPITPPETPETSNPPDTPPDEPRMKLIISPVRTEKQFDGEVLSAKNEVEGFAEYAQRGYTYDVIISGERTEPGITFSKIEKIIIYDASGEDVTEKFDIVSHTGIVHVYLEILNFSSQDATKIYDGTPLENNSVIYNGTLTFPAHHYSISKNASITDVGTVNNTFLVTILNEYNSDITELYKIVTTYGELTVTPAEITLIADSAAKVYDGEELTCNSYTINGNLADGDEIISCSVIGKQQEIGRSENIIDPDSIIIKNQNDDNVVQNYIIKLIPGQLKVTPP